MRPRIALVSAAAVVALAAVPAAAQIPQGQPTVTVTFASSVARAPAGEVTSHPGNVTYEWPPGGVTMADTPIHLEVVDAPPWTNATATPDTVYAPVGPSSPDGGSVTLPFDVLLDVASDAPSDQQGTITVRAEAEPNGNMGPAEGAGTMGVDVEHTSSEPVAPADARAEDVGDADASSIPGPSAALAAAAASLGAVALGRHRSR